MTSDDRPDTDQLSSQLDIAEQLSVIVRNLVESAVLLFGAGMVVIDVLSQMAPIVAALFLVWIQAR